MSQIEELKTAIVNEIAEAVERAAIVYEATLAEVRVERDAAVAAAVDAEARAEAEAAAAEAALAAGERYKGEIQELIEELRKPGIYGQEEPEPEPEPEPGDGDEDGADDDDDDAVEVE